MKDAIYLLITFVLFRALSSATFAQSTFPLDGSSVGIGTTTPSARLEVRGTQANTGTRADLFCNGENSFLGVDASFQRFGFVKQYNKLPVLGADKTTPIIFGHFDSTNLLGTISSTTAFSENMRIDPNGRVGVGTSTPRTLLQLTSANPTLSLVPADGAFGRTSSIDFYGTFGYASNGDTGARRLAQIVVGSTSPQAWSGAYLSIQGMTTDGGTPTSVLFISTASGNVGIGTTSPSHKLEVAGTVRAKEIVVESTGWADYILDPMYQLESIDEVEAHIKAHGSLPGIPKADEVAQNGIDVGTMQAKLLAKIEELTLRQIAQEKQLRAHAEEISLLQQENAKLRRQTANLDSSIVP